jgi:enoyl-CoA hydratase/carnithine racemase
MLTRTLFALPLSPQAKALGLVDQIVEKEGLLPAAEKVMTSLVKLPGHAVASTKAGLRQSFCAEWEPFFTGEEPEGGWATLCLPETKKTLEGVLARLSSGAKGGGGGAKAETGGSSAQTASKL